MKTRYVTMIDILYRDAHSRTFLVMKVMKEAPTRRWLRQYVLDRYPNKKDLMKVHTISADTYVTENGDGDLKHKSHKVLLGPTDCVAAARQSEENDASHAS